MYGVSEIFSEMVYYEIAMKEHDPSIQHEKTKNLCSTHIEGVRRMGRTVLEWAIRTLENSYWKPGDPITRFSVSKEEGGLVSPSEVGDDEDIITPIDVSGGTMTPFFPQEEKAMLEWLEENKERLREEAYRK